MRLQVRASRREYGHGALVEKDNTAEVFEALADPTKHVVVHTAPSIRATLGECFDMPIGTNVKGKMVAALKNRSWVEFAKLYYGPTEYNIYADKLSKAYAALK